MTQYYTPEQYILKQVAEYPTLYAYPSYAETRFSVMDHVLNTIGNGIADLNEFIFQEFDVDYAKKFITREPIYYGYIVHEYNYSNPIIVLDSERSQYPDMGYWIEQTKRGKKQPYPNFKKQYSTVYESDFKFIELGTEWIKEAIWFYRESLNYFTDLEQYKSYHYAFPTYDSVRQCDVSDKTLKDFQQHIHCKYDSHEALSKAYGVAGYDGNDYDYLCRRWDQERTRIVKFINDTIAMLETKLYV